MSEHERHLRALARLQPSLAKVGRRYYWAVWRFTTLDEDRQLPDDFGLHRQVDGFAATREDATTAVVEAMDAIDRSCC